MTKIDVNDEVWILRKLLYSHSLIPFSKREISDIVGPQKIFIPTPRKVVGNSKGGGRVSKAKNF